MARDLPALGAGASDPAARFHALDAARALACIMVVVFHTTESFEPGAAGWAILDRSPSPFLSVVRHASASFVMELLFLTAGFVARMSCHRRGPGPFIRDRIQRILVPLVIGWLIMFPIGVYLWLLGASVSGTLPQLGIPPELAGLPVWKLWLGVFVTGQVVNVLNLTHLWFLHQLLVIYGLVLVVRAVWRRVDSTGATDRWLDRALAAVLRSPAASLWLAVLTVPMLALMTDPWKNLVVDTPAYSLWPHLPTTVLYGSQFAIGWLLQRQPELLSALAGGWRRNLVVAALVVLPSRWLGQLAGPTGLERGLHLALYALMMWGFLLGVVGFFQRPGRRPSPRWRPIADASYWFYVAHWPLVIALQIAVARVPLHWAPKLVAINLVVFAALIWTYQHWVQSTFIGRQLNGRVQPRASPGDRR
jgi:glucan biosynthesis protein C